jgi:Uma2 family endonuclease
MDVMTTPTLGPGHTRADLDRMPDDGNRYELIEGEIVVSPSPTSHHQVISARLFRLLDDACPSGMMVLYAPLDVALDELSVVEPDLIVFDRADLGERGLDKPPLLAVEILSPSTRSRDLVRKKRLYERAGIQSYWVIDPDEDAIAMTAWELRDGRYQVVAAIAGDEEWEATAPYDVRVVPSQLVVR